MKIATHNNLFHADEVFALAILKMIYPDTILIRTRDSARLQEADIRVDVGGKYDSEGGDFDHHQAEFDLKRENGIPYASAGLIWKHFGGKVAGKEVVDYIEKELIQQIDANDTGFDTYSINVCKPYTISDFIKSLNPSWSEQSEESFNRNFEDAVLIATKLLRQEIKRAEEVINAKNKIILKINESDKEYIILEGRIPWKETVVENSDLKYVISYDKIEDNWAILAVPISMNSFENRKDLPAEWGGLFNKDLQKITGVKDAIFCHKKLFFAISKSKEGAIKLVEIALGKK
ncbi:metal-dependent hydrolase [Candidatus Pacearchaeota archaeon CG10_big_fil_rev_8_21_14_0_10_34_76]|nr:MAG: metal-dependent hydrolase [Candidatus Pacearchaeota archaeon CG10_big_fil_rev_8_21_14_0_10_34_76]